MQIEIFSKVKDPRDLGKVKHELEDVLRMALIGVLCDCEDCDDISDMVTDREEEFKAAGLLTGHDFAIASSRPSVTTWTLQVAMGFVGNYAPCGLSPQMYDMPVILKSVQQAISKRLDALESRPAPSNGGSKFNTSKFREEVKEWERGYLETIRTNVSEVCTLIFDEATPNMIIKPQFDKFQEDMKIKLTDIEKRIIIAEENAGNRISLFTLSRLTYITERYNNPDRHPDPTPSFLEKYKKEIVLIVSIVILFITISLFAIATENKTLKQDNAALRNALEQLHSAPDSPLAAPKPQYPTDSPQN